MGSPNEIERTETPRTAQFGRFHLLEPIGQGGMADVIVAVVAGPGQFNKLVVLKTIRDQIQGDRDLYARMFLDEARLAARLNHPNVVHTYEVGEQEGVYYIAMEYLEGQPLNQLQRKIGLDGLPLEARLRILIDTAHGLHHAHELTDYSGNPLHVVHRDVSPHNVFLTYDGQVKLLDFGIAKMRDAQTVTVMGHLKGKLDYMAPEQLRGDTVDQRSDVFALGVMMWEMLAGKPMSGGRSVTQVVRVHNRLTRQEPSLRKVMPGLDEELLRICDKALAHVPSERYASAREFARDLEAYLTQRSLTPSSQQLSQILKSMFESERVERRKRIEAALEIVARERTLITETALHNSGSRLTLIGRLRQEAEQNGSEQTRSLGVPGTNSMSGLVSVRKGPTTLQKTLIIASSVCVAVVVSLHFTSTPTSAPLHAPMESQTHTALPSELKAPVENVAPPRDMVKLRVESQTPGIQIELDGSAILQLPFEAEVARDGIIHRLVASAPGFATATRVLIFDRDRTVNLELSKAEVPDVPVRSRDERRPSRAVARMPEPEVAAVAAEPEPAQPAPPAPPAPPRRVEEPAPGEEMQRAERKNVDMSDEEPWQ